MDEIQAVIQVCLLAPEKRLMAYDSRQYKGGQVVPLLIRFPLMSVMYITRVQVYCKEVYIFSNAFLVSISRISLALMLIH